MEHAIKYEIDWDAVCSDVEFFEKNSDKHPQVLLKISDDLLLKYYSAAQAYLEEENFLAARDAFLFLTFLNPEFPTFWIQLGIAYHSLNEYQKAIEAYELAEIIDPQNPIIHSNLCKCGVYIKN